MLSIKRREKNVSKLVSKFSAITTIIDHNFKAKELFRLLHHKHLWYEWNDSFFVIYDTFLCIFVWFVWNNFLHSIDKKVSNNYYRFRNDYLPEYDYFSTQVFKYHLNKVGKKLSAFYLCPKPSVLNYFLQVSKWLIYWFKCIIVFSSHGKRQANKNNLLE